MRTAQDDRLQLRNNSRGTITAPGNFFRIIILKISGFSNLSGAAPAFFGSQAEFFPHVCA